MGTLQAYWKVIVAALGAALVVVQSSITDDVIDPSEKLLIVGAFFGAVLVYGASNPTLPFWKWTKALAEFGSGVAAYLGVEWANGSASLTSAQWVAVAIIGLAALGVAAVPGPQLTVSTSGIQRPTP
jgi:hypothetical protein